MKYGQELTIKAPERRYFIPCSSIFIVNFEQVNVDWEDVNGFKSTGRVSLFFVRVKIISYLV